MAVDPSAVSMEDFIARWSDDVMSVVQNAQSWVDNKIDVNQDYDFTSAKTALTTAKSNFESAVHTVTSA